MPLPQEVAGGGVETDHVAFAAERVNLAALDSRRGVGAALVHPWVELAGVGVGPDGFTGLFVQADNVVGSLLVAHGVDAAVDNGDGRKSGMHIGPPLLLHIDEIEIGFLRDAVVFGAAELWPVGAIGRSCDDTQTNGIKQFHERLRE